MSNHTSNIWEYVQYHVENKSVQKRIWHSHTFQPMRSAANSRGSAASKAGKLLGAAVRTSLSLIPVPAVGTILSAVQGAMEGKYREYLHEKHLKGLPTTDPDYIKFSLKGLSVDGLDRMRWKVDKETEKLRTLAAEWNADMQQAITDSRTCDAMVVMARQIAQAERRLAIFEKNVGEIKALMLACEIWAGKSRESVTKFRDDTQKAFDQIVKDDQKLGAGASARHVNCGAFCTMGARGAIDRQRDVAINLLASVARTAAEGIDVESFLSINRETFTVTDALGAYRFDGD